MSKQNVILSLCDLTGAMAKSWEEAGYRVIKFDIQRNGRDGDVVLHEYHDDWNVIGIIAQPPCTHFAGSGARWWKEKGDPALYEGLQVVDACLRLVQLYQPEWWVLENPVGRLTRYIGKYKMTFQPHEYAHLAETPADEQYTKRTCLWGDFNVEALQQLKGDLPPVDGSKMWRLPPSEERQNLRSKAPEGFAKAFFMAHTN